MTFFDFFHKVLPFIRKIIFLFATSGLVLYILSYLLEQKLGFYTKMFMELVKNFSRSIIFAAAALVLYISIVYTALYFTLSTKYFLAVMFAFFIVFLIWSRINCLQKF